MGFEGLQFRFRTCFGVGYVVTTIVITTRLRMSRGSFKASECYKACRASKPRVK